MCPYGIFTTTQRNPAIARVSQISAPVSSLPSVAKNGEIPPSKTAMFH